MTENRLLISTFTKKTFFVYKSHITWLYVSFVLLCWMEIMPSWQFIFGISCMWRCGNRSYKMHLPLKSKNDFICNVIRSQIWKILEELHMIHSSVAWLKYRRPRFIDKIRRISLPDTFKFRTVCSDRMHPSKIEANVLSRIFV